MKPILALTAVASLAACAPDPSTVEATYVSPVAYRGLTCSQLSAEAARLSARLAEVTGKQEVAAVSDAVDAVVSAFIFWPALLWIGSEDQSPELARLRGEAEALQSAATARGC